MAYRLFLAISASLTVFVEGGGVKLLGHLAFGRVQSVSDLSGFSYHSEVRHRMSNWLLMSLTCLIVIVIVRDLRVEITWIVEST